METVIFIGIQATGKSTFYIENFFKTHLRLSLDLLNTRNKENTFMDTCFSVQQPFVVDNTNITVKKRKNYIAKSKSHKYKIIGYYFQSRIEEALERNEKRIGKEKIPVKGIRAMYNKLEVPGFDEGFDELYHVEIIKDDFRVREWERK